MFCKNCGNELLDTDTFCPYCGNSVTPKTNAEFINNAGYNTPAFSAPPIGSPAPIPPKKNGKKIAIISAIVAVALAVIGVVVWLLLDSDNEKDKDESSKGYIEEVEAYLDFIAKKEDDVNKYLSDAYGIGEVYSGKDADAIHKLLMKATFEEESEYDMGYYYDSFEYDSWEDYTKEGEIESFYDAMEYEYGDWKLDYKITDSKKLSDSKTENLLDEWESIVENYEYALDDLDFDSDDRKELRDFIESIEDLEPKTAYEVEVEIEIDGDDGSASYDKDFTVAKIGKEWVILEGPALYDFYY